MSVVKSGYKKIVFVMSCDMTLYFGSCRVDLGLFGPYSFWTFDLPKLSLRLCWALRELGKLLSVVVDLHGCRPIQIKSLVYVQNSAFGLNIFLPQHLSLWPLIELNMVTLIVHRMLDKVIHCLLFYFTWLKKF